MTKRSIELPFSPEDIRSGKFLPDPGDDPVGKAWDRVLKDDNLADVRAKLSIDQMRRLLKTAIGGPN